MSEEILNAARETLALDIWPVPIKSKGKNPVGKGWTEFRIGLDDLGERFSNDQGLGWLLGIAPRHVGDVDIDSAECLRLAAHVPLPATNRIFGRKSARSAHWMYEFPAAFECAQFRDPVRKKENEGKAKEQKQKDMLVELRSVGQQTVVPPTPWFAPDGEESEDREWERRGDFGKPAHRELIARLARLATAGLLLRYSTASFEEPMALAGIFAAGGFPVEDAVEILSGVWRVARPESVEQCERDVRSTYQLCERNERAYGYRHYTEMVGEDRAHLITKAIYEWLGLRRPAKITSGGFVYSDNGKLLPLLANAVAMLEESPEWQGAVGFNEFTLFTEAKNPPPFLRGPLANWTDTDDSQTAIWLQQHGVVCNSRIAAEAVQTIARKNRFHPVKEYFESVAASWDKLPRLDEMLVLWAGAEDSDYSRAVSRCWMISAVARIYEPGCQADYTLILEGKQGKLKSKFLYTLSGPEWFSDHISDLSSKDARLELHGVLIMELAELSAIKRTEDVERYKAFLTSRADKFRAPYDRRTQTIPRSNVFAGTTNNAEPFTDETGNRRFWPVKISNIDIGALAKARDQLWGEAVARYKKGEHWWFESAKLEADAEAEQEKRYAEGVWDPTILEWIKNPKQRCEEEWDSKAHAKVPVPVTPFDSTEDKVTVRDILVHALRKEVKDHQQRDRNQIARCLVHAGWTQHSEKVGGVTLRFYHRPKEPKS